MVAIEQSAKKRYNCITHLKLVDTTLEEKRCTPNTQKKQNNSEKNTQDIRRFCFFACFFHVMPLMHTPSQYLKKT